MGGAQDGLSVQAESEVCEQNFLVVLRASEAHQKCGSSCDLWWWLGAHQHQKFILRSCEIQKELHLELPTL